MLNPKVSVIIPVYNQYLYIKEALESVCAQTYKNIEIVCVNDGSTDNSSEIIKEFIQNKNNIIFIDNKINKGVVSARNQAIEVSSGEYILPLDADDTIEPTYIQKAVDILTNNSEIGIVYCKAKFIGKKNENWDLPIFNKNNILFENCIFCSALFRKKDFNDLGKYKLYMEKGCEDWDLWLSFIENNFKVYQIPEILFNYRKHESTSRTEIAIKNFDIVRENILRNHIELYATNIECIKRIFYTNIDKKNFINADKKYKKYKCLYKIFLMISIIQIIILFFVILLKGNL